MNTVLGDGGIRAITDSIGGLLKNPAVLQGLIAAVSAISASQKVKKPNSDSGKSDDGSILGFDIGSIIGLLPQLLPLFSAFTQGPAHPDNIDINRSGINDGPDIPGLNFDDDTVDDADKKSEESVDTGVIAAMSGDVGLSGMDGILSGGVYGGSHGIAERRENLLLAIKPYLSPSRQSAADAIIQVNKLSGLFG